MRCQGLSDRQILRCDIPTINASLHGGSKFESISPTDEIECDSNRCHIGFYLLLDIGHNRRCLLVVVIQRPGRHFVTDEGLNPRPNWTIHHLGKRLSVIDRSKYYVRIGTIASRRIDAKSE